MSVLYALTRNYEREWKRSSMATWRLGLHATLLAKYMHNKCGQNPVLETFCKSFTVRVESLIRPWLVVRRGHCGSKPFGC